ncbi:MAG: hypothetical protein M1833_005779 [Piccolia ochrophora]|nr:MAG: hypothetical protein M1833_005779 [Piccolia ochrophora]
MMKMFSSQMSEDKYAIEQHSVLMNNACARMKRFDVEVQHCHSKLEEVDVKLEETKLAQSSNPQTPIPHKVKSESLSSRKIALLSALSKGKTALLGQRVRESRLRLEHMKEGLLNRRLVSNSSSSKKSCSKGRGCVSERHGNPDGYGSINENQEKHDPSQDLANPLFTSNSPFTPVRPLSALTEEHGSRRHFSSSTDDEVDTVVNGILDGRPIRFTKLLGNRGYAILDEQEFCDKTENVSAKQLPLTKSPVCFPGGPSNAVPAAKSRRSRSDSYLSPMTMNGATRLEQQPSRYLVSPVPFKINKATHLQATPSKSFDYSHPVLPSPESPLIRKKPHPKPQAGLGTEISHIEQEPKRRTLVVNQAESFLEDLQSYASSQNYDSEDFHKDSNTQHTPNEGSEIESDDSGETFILESARALRNDPENSQQAHRSHVWPPVPLQSSDREPETNAAVTLAQNISNLRPLRHKPAINNLRPVVPSLDPTRAAHLTEGLAILEGSSTPPKDPASTECYLRHNNADDVHVEVLGRARKTPTPVRAWLANLSPTPKEAGRVQVQDAELETADGEGFLRCEEVEDVDVERSELPINEAVATDRSEPADSVLTADEANDVLQPQDTGSYMEQNERCMLPNEDEENVIIKYADVPLLEPVPVRPWLTNPAPMLEEWDEVLQFRDVELGIAARHPRPLPRTVVMAVCSVFPHGTGTGAC